MLGKDNHILTPTYHAWEVKNKVVNQIYITLTCLTLTSRGSTLDVRINFEGNSQLNNMLPFSLHGCILYTV